MQSSVRTTEPAAGSLPLHRLFKSNHWHIHWPHVTHGSHRGTIHHLFIHLCPYDLSLEHLVILGPGIDAVQCKVQGNDSWVKVTEKVKPELITHQSKIHLQIFFLPYFNLGWNLKGSLNKLQSFFFHCSGQEPDDLISFVPLILMLEPQEKQWARVKTIIILINAVVATSDHRKCNVSVSFFSEFTEINASCAQVDS